MIALPEVRGKLLRNEPLAPYTWFRVGGAAISRKHCGFVVNMGGATCADVLALTDRVCAIVKEKTGFTLEKEIRVVE